MIGHDKTTFGKRVTLQLVDAIKTTLILVRNVDNKRSWRNETNVQDNTEARALATQLSLCNLIT